MTSIRKLQKFVSIGLGLLLASMLAATQVVCAQAPGGMAYAKVSANVKPSSLKAGGHGTVLVTIDIAPGFHINSVKPADPSMIPTKLELKKTTGFSYGRVAYPPSKTVKESYSPKPMLVYQGDTVIRVPVTAASSLKPGHYTLTGTLTYQGCNHSACYPPQNPTVRVPITVK